MTDELRDLEPNTNLAKFDDLNNFQDIENYFRMMRNQNTFLIQKPRLLKRSTSLENFDSKIIKIAQIV